MREGRTVGTAGVVRAQGLILVTPINSVEVPIELVSVLPDDDSFNKRAI